MFNYNCKYLISQKSYEYRTEKDIWICQTKVSRYLRGKKDGPEKIYAYSDKDLKYPRWTLIYKNGKRHGQEIGYYPNTKIIEHTRTWRDNKLLGAEIYYYKNGNLKAKHFWKNGVQHGTCYGLKKDGTIEYVQKYENGRIFDSLYK